MRSLSGIAFRRRRTFLLGDDLFYYVYLIRSLRLNQQIYIGYTRNLKRRLIKIKHNTGCSPHTSKYKPWKLEVFFGFKNKLTAMEFEQYLKSHSGKAFATKRLLKQ